MATRKGLEPSASSVTG